MSDIEPRLRLFLFGPMRLSRDGEDFPTLPDQLCKALSLLVLNGRCMNRDTLVERLWPDATVDSGRHQLRNLLTRLRTLVGVEIDRQSELVVVRDAVWCDIEEFIRVASRAASATEPTRTSLRLGLQAQSLWTGPPLEAWRYEQWAIQLRQKIFGLQRRLWALLDQGGLAQPSR